MKFLLPTAAALLCAAPVMAQEAPQTDAVAVPPGGAELFDLLASRVEGEPVACLPRRGLRNMTIIDGTAIVFDYGSTLYVTKTAHPESLRDRDRLVSPGGFGRLCRYDVVFTEDRYHRVPTGNIRLTDFVPYKRAKQDEG